MSSDWPELSIDEIKASTKNAIAMGPFGSRIKAENFIDVGVPVIKGGNLNGDFLLENSFDFLIAEKADELQASNAYRRDLVITHRGTIGQVGIIPDNSRYERYVVSQSQLKVTLDQNKVNPFFVYYFLRSPIGQHRLLANSSQVGVPAIAQASTSVRAIMVPCPKKNIQDQVVEILLNLDHKIELSRQTNQTLEQIAQALFKSWFVDFEPVKAKMTAKQAGAGAEQIEQAAICAISGKTPEQLAHLDPKILQKLKTTAALFPDALVDSELGEIPAGWKIGPLSDIAMFADGRIDVSELSLENYISTENMLENKQGILIASSLPNVNSVPNFNIGQILISNIRPYFKKIWLARFEGGRSNDVLGLESINSNCVEFLYNLLYQDEFFSFMMATSKGAKMPRGDKRAIMGWNCIQPTLEIKIAYARCVQNYYKRIDSTIRENEYLESLRNTLLPKLLSGEINLSNG
jgi:type I restriction enzyme, S subunit